MTRSRGTRRGVRGITLLEVLVAMTVLAIGILGAMRAFSSCLRTSRDAQTYDVAAMLASQAASQLERSMPLSPGEYSGDFGEDVPDYTWEAVVDQADEMLVVDVTVLWGPKERQQHYQLRAFFRAAAQQAAPSGAGGPSSSGGAS